MLAAEQVTYRVGQRSLVSGVSLTIQSGQITALAGPNGAGKSTLLKVLSGELAPAHGCVTLDGLPIHRLTADDLASRRAVVPQAADLKFPFTALEVVLLGATVPGFNRSDRAHVRAAVSIMEAVGLHGYEARSYSELSGGERQRVQISRALCQLDLAPTRPGLTQLLLLDEPTASLDLAHQQLVIEELRRQARRGRAILIVIHDLNQAAILADTIVMMRGGCVAATGTPSVVYQTDTLSAVYGCSVGVDAVGQSDVPLVYLPNDV